jgi:hypothetical protein
MAVNLSRNTKVYFTTNVNAVTGVITDANSGFTAANTFEIQVLDGYSFSQGTQQQTITLGEAGNTPVRGQRSFNTQLDPVDFSFSTYVRPLLASSVVAPVERVLWNALMGDTAIDTTGLAVTTGLARTGTVSPTATVVLTGDVRSSIPVGTVINFNGSTAHPHWNQPGVVTGSTFATNTTATVILAKSPGTAAGSSAGTGTTARLGQWAASGTAAGAFSYTSSMNSNKNQLQRFGLIFIVDTAVYAVDNCALDSASIDFGLDAIATIAWAGKGTQLKQLNTVTGSHLGSNSTAASAAANYITNKLSTMTLQSNIGGSDNTEAVSKTYQIAITGGNLTISNNISYLTPANLGVVNTPIGYFTGQRSITGNVTAYLRTGESYNSSGTLLSDLLAAVATTSEPKFRTQLELGGIGNPNKVEFEMPGSVLQIPQVNVADVVATTINFTAQGYAPAVTGPTAASYDVTQANDIQVRYYSA